MQVPILIQAYRNREEWGAAFQIFGKFDFLRTDTSNGRVENYKFVESSQKCITFVALQYLCCTFFLSFSKILFHILEPPTMELYGSEYTYYI